MLSKLWTRAITHFQDQKSTSKLLRKRNISAPDCDKKDLRDKKLQCHEVETVVPTNLDDKERCNNHNTDGTDVESGAEMELTRLHGGPEQPHKLHYTRLMQLFSVK